MSRIEKDDRQSVFSVGESEQIKQSSIGERFWRGSRRKLINPLKIVLSDSRGVVGLGIILLYVFMGTFGTLLVRTPGANQAEQLMPVFSSIALPLGSDGLGQDLFALMVHSTTPMLKMIITGGLFATVMAVILGTTAGYKGGSWDAALMTFTDVAMTIPGLPLMIVLAGIFEPTNPYLVGFLLAINAWAGLARAIRSQVLPLREAAYVEASRSMGVSTSRIIRRDILPNIMPFALISFMNSSRQIIYNSVALYFLGILPFTTLNWGVVINLAYEQGALTSSGTWHWILVPIATIVLLSLGTILFAQSTDRIFNPRVRAKHDSETETSAAEMS